VSCLALCQTTLSFASIYWFVVEDGDGLAVSVGLGVAELLGEAVGLVDVMVGVGVAVGVCECLGCGVLLGLGVDVGWFTTTLGVGVGVLGGTVPDDGVAEGELRCWAVLLPTSLRGCPDS
jgi:hypothetical protein